MCLYSTATLYAKCGYNLLPDLIILNCDKHNLDFYGEFYHKFSKSFANSNKVEKCYL